MDWWSWRPHIRTLLRKLCHRISVFNRIFHMLDYQTCIAYYNGLVLPYLDYADIVWWDQMGLKSKMDQLQSFQNKFAKRIEAGKIKLPPKDLLLFYVTWIRPVAEYACEVFHDPLSKYLSDYPEGLQRRACKIILPELSNENSLNELGLLSLPGRWQNMTTKLFGKIVNHRWGQVT